MSETHIETTIKTEQDQTSEAIKKDDPPRNLVEGVTRGLGRFLVGAIGGIAQVVLLTCVAANSGYQCGVISGADFGIAGYVISAILGAVIGIVVGLVLGVLFVPYTLIVCALEGTYSIILGVATVPKSVAALMRGESWNNIDSVVEEA